MSTQQTTYFRAAAYLRLSREDKEETESASIATQRDIILEYARLNGIPIVAEYADDGYSGTNFDRPDFKRMCTDIEAGRINCVITKDLSRLGRNSARTSDLLDEYFPQYGVRFITVTDGYDSAAPNAGIVLITPLLLAAHELYARDTSGKIRSSIRSKMEKGQFIGSFAPYGYEKDLTHGDKNHLIPDEAAADVVCRMFRMAYEGCSPGQIASAFNREGILSPALYRCQKYPHLNTDNYTRHGDWTSSGICRMLANQVYLGKLQQGKYQKLSFKNKEQIRSRREDWITAEGTHEPLVSQDVFDAVQRRKVARRCQPTGGFHNLFSGVAVCADCGRHMTPSGRRKKSTGTYNLCCQGYKSRTKKECSNHFIDYKALCEIVTRDIRYWTALTAEEKAQISDDLRKSEEKQREDAGESLEAKRRAAQSRKADLTAVLTKLYEDHALGRIQDALYGSILEVKEQELEAVSQELAALEKQSGSSQTGEALYRQFFALLDGIPETVELSRDLILTLIDRIEVEQGEKVKGRTGKRITSQKIRIFYKFIGFPSISVP